MIKQVDVDEDYIKCKSLIATILKGIDNMDISECALCLDCRECIHYYECNIPSHDDE